MAIFDFNGSRRLGRERNLFQGGGWQSKNEERGAIHSNSKTNMVSQMNDHL